MTGFPGVYESVLTDVRVILACEDNWTQGAFAENPNGLIVGVDSEQAVCWCLSGAVTKAVHRYRNSILLEAKITSFLEELIEDWTEDKYMSVVGFNDNSTYQEVVDFLDCAIICAQGAEL